MSEPISLPIESRTTAREVATWILSNCAARYVNPEGFSQSPQDVINFQIHMAEVKIAEFVASLPVGESTPFDVEELQQYRKDWPLLLREIALLSDDEEWSGPDACWTEDDILECFDPWDTLRKLQFERRTRELATKGNQAGESAVEGNAGMEKEGPSGMARRTDETESGVSPRTAVGSVNPPIAELGLGESREPLPYEEIETCSQCGSVLGLKGDTWEVVANQSAANPLPSVPAEIENLSSDVPKSSNETRNI